MAKRISKKYFYYQVSGWGMLLFLGWLLLRLEGLSVVSRPAEMLLMEVVAGMLVSHLLRIIIIRYGWLQLSVKTTISRLLPVVILACIMAGLVRRLGLYFLYGMTPQTGVLATVFADTFDSGLVLVPWTMLYYLYHYAGKVYHEKAKNRKLELRVMEMKKQSEESGTNMDDLISTLQRIQGLIEEDPGKSREEITEFSRMLRKGYLSS